MGGRVPCQQCARSPCPGTTHRRKRPIVPGTSPYPCILFLVFFSVCIHSVCFPFGFVLSLYACTSLHPSRCENIPDGSTERDRRGFFCQVYVECQVECQVIVKCMWSLSPSGVRQHVHWMFSHFEGCKGVQSQRECVFRDLQLGDGCMFPATLHANNPACRTVCFSLRFIMNDARMSTIAQLRDNGGDFSRHKGSLVQ